MKYLKMFDNFINEKYKILDFLLFKVDVPEWGEILDRINPEHIWGIENTKNPALPGGYQTTPHVTLLFGIHRVSTSEIDFFLKFNNVSSFKFDVEGIDIFKGKSYDVLKMSVVPSPELKKLNRTLKNRFPAIRQHDEYIPHITIAYIKKQYSHLYIDPSYRATFYSNTIIHSMDEARIQNEIVLSEPISKVA